MPDKHQKPVIAVDIGGTKMLLAVIQPDGRMIDRENIPTRVGEGVHSVIGRLGSAIEGLLSRNGIKTGDLDGIGIAAAGGIDTARGVIVTPSPNLPDWKDIPLRKIIEDRFGTVACVVNDASAAAFGEFCFGAGRDISHMVMVTLGTGIGGGIVVNDRLYLGASGAAAELGHMTIADAGPECPCGNTGCLEMLASGKAIERDIRSRLRQGQESSALDMVGGDIDKVTAETVGRAAAQGDALASEVLARAAYYLGAGMVNFVNIFNPEMIVLGGGMAALGESLIGPGRRLVEERAFSISSSAVQIVTAELGNEAGVYGVAAYLRQQQERSTL